MITSNGEKRRAADRETLGTISSRSMVGIVTSEGEYRRSENKRHGWNGVEGEAMWFREERRDL